MGLLDDIVNNNSYIKDASEGAKKYTKSKYTTASNYASEYTSKVKSVGDDTLVDLIISAASKKERINSLLHDKDADCRVGTILFGLGVPPTVSFGIVDISDDSEKKQELLADVSN